jgi:transposase
MKVGLRRDTLRDARWSDAKEALGMLYVGLDFSRKRLQWSAFDESGAEAARGVVVPEPSGLSALVERAGRHGAPVLAAIESMTGSRFVHDQLELRGWDVRIADAQRVKGLAPLACKTDRIDARVLAELAWRDLIPEIWLPDPAVRAERERARFRLHLVKHRTALKSRIHQTLVAHGVPCPVSDLFGVAGRRLLRELELPEPWQSNVEVSLTLIDQLTVEINGCEAELRRLGASHPYVRRLVTVPGIAWILAYTIGSEIGDISRFRTPTKLVAYTGLCPRVYQSGERDRRGPLAKNGPRYLRWALIEAAQHAARTPAYRDLYQSTKKRLGKQRGSRVAAIVVARRLAEASWWMLTRDEPFAPAGAA